MRMRAGTAITMSLVLAACAGGGAGSTAPSASAPELEPEPTVEVSIRVGPDGPELPEEAVADLQAYGRRHADEFGGLYVDDQGQGSFVLLFTDNLDEHAAALTEIWPRVTVRGVQFTEAALTELLESPAFRAIGGGDDGVEYLSAGLDTMNNRVTLELKSDDPTLELRLEAQYGGMVEVTVYPIPGPWENVANGPGWRLLAAGEVSNEEAYTVRAATDDAAWDEMWAAIGLVGEPPAIDFAHEVAVSFGHGIGSSCREMRLDGVEVRDGVVFSRASDPLSPRACTADLVGAAMFVVAVERDPLPDDGFTLQLSETSATCPDCGFSEQIEVPLP
jgi:hypothetical protein